MSPVEHSIKLETKKTLALGIPLIASQLIYSCSTFISTALIARLGENALAASVLVSTIWMTLTFLFFGILNSISILISHAYGLKNYKSISIIMAQSYLLGIAVTVCIIFLLLIVPPVLNYTHQPPAVIALAIEYNYSLIWNVPGLVLLIIYEQFLTGINRGGLVLKISLLVVPIEIPIIYGLIFGKFGFPALGIAGIGYGFTITYTLSAIFLTIYLVKSQQYRHMAIFSKMLSLHYKYLKELFRLGLPMGCMQIIEVSTFTIATFWIARFGTTLLAAHQIVMQYLGLLITIVFAMSQAVTVRVAYAAARLDIIGVRYGAYVGMCINTFFMLIIAMAFYLFPNFFLSLDISVNASENQLLVKETIILLNICGVLMLADNVRVVGFGALRGLKDTRFSMFTSFFSFWIVGLTAAYFFGMVKPYKAEGIWWGLLIGIACGAIIILLRLQWLINHINLRSLRMKDDSSSTV